MLKRIASDSKEICDECPDNLVIIGGGRWARQIIETLHTLVPQSTRLTVYTPRNSKLMVVWLTDRGLNLRINVSDCMPILNSNESNAAIVVNAASDHEASAAWALKQRCPVLVEKPLCLNSDSAQHIIDLALEKNVYLATAHVFLFADYINEFARHVTEVAEVVSISILWMDQHSEKRYGEIKNYDAGLPVYADWLPHILSILNSIVGAQDLVCEKLIFLKGGAHLIINFNYGSIPCTVELVRNGESRKRIIEVTTKENKLTLNFSTEPGLIYKDDIFIHRDANWENGPKPVARMLKAFLKGAAGDARDIRLDNSIGLFSTKVIDQVATLYRAELSAWLFNRIAMDQDIMDNDLRYALIEFLQAEDVASDIPIEHRIAYLYRKIREQFLKFSKARDFSLIESVTRAIKVGKYTSYL